jgi:hypothetical protein
MSSVVNCHYIRWYWRIYMGHRAHTGETDEAKCTEKTAWEITQRQILWFATGCQSEYGLTPPGSGQGPVVKPRWRQLLDQLSDYHVLDKSAAAFSYFNTWKVLNSLTPRLISGISGSDGGEDVSAVFRMMKRQATRCYHTSKLQLQQC